MASTINSIIIGSCEHNRDKQEKINKYKSLVPTYQYDNVSFTPIMPYYQSLHIDDKVLSNAEFIEYFKHSNIDNNVLSSNNDTSGIIRLICEQHINKNIQGCTQPIEEKITKTPITHLIGDAVYDLEILNGTYAKIVCEDKSEISFVNDGNSLVLPAINKTNPIIFPHISLKIQTDGTVIKYKSVTVSSKYYTTIKEIIYSSDRIENDMGSYYYIRRLYYDSLIVPKNKMTCSN